MVTGEELRMSYEDEDYAYKLTKSYGRIRKGEMQIMERMSNDMVIEQNEKNYEKEINEFEEWAEMQKQTIDKNDEIPLEQIIQHSIERLKRRLKQLIAFNKELEKEMNYCCIGPSNIQDNRKTINRDYRRITQKTMLITIAVLIIIIISRSKNLDRVVKAMQKKCVVLNIDLMDIKGILTITFISAMSVFIMNLS